MSSMLRKHDLDYSRFEAIDYDSDEEKCAAPVRHRPSGGEQKPLSSHDNLLLNTSVEKGREQALKNGQSLGPVRYCHTCRARGAGLRCGKCKSVFFCGKECQRIGWKTHKFQCREVSNAEAREIEKRLEYEEAVARRVEDEKLEYSPATPGPLQSLMMMNAVKAGWKVPPTRKDYSLRLAVIVPYRNQLPLQDREPHLAQLVPHLHKVLRKHVQLRNVRLFKILIVEQNADGRAFNRGALIDVGFHYLDNSGEEYDQIILHDADLVPACENLEYWYGTDVPTKHVVHLTAQGYPKHNGPNKIKGASRGVVALRCDDFKESNGYPLDVWGWCESIEDRIWADRLGANLVRYYPCPVGAWTDLDQVSLRSLNEKEWTSLCNKEPLIFDSQYLKACAPQLIEPRGRNGELAAGPTRCRALLESEKQDLIVHRTGGLDTLRYKVVQEGKFMVHSTRIVVTLDFL